MGASQSSPGSSTQHVFASDTPVQFSQELIDSLQASSETNSTRAKTLDLHIQQRVAAELAKIQAAESKKLLDLQSELASASDDSKSPSSSSSSSPQSKGKDSSSSKSQKTTQAVQAEIETLKKRLGERKTLKELPKEVERARESVVGCLRVNDRRPLDCWREVEAFKREVTRMEEAFVGGVL